MTEPTWVAELPASDAAAVRAVLARKSWRDAKAGDVERLRLVADMIAHGVCCHSWRAPRVDVPDSLDVNHVCGRGREHSDGHLCSCGAFT